MANEHEVTTREQELAEYLQERIKPGLNRGAIPLLARSIAKEIVRQEGLNGGPDDHDEEPDVAGGVEAEAGDQPDDEADVEAGDDPDDEPAVGADDEPEDDADDQPDAESEEPEGESESPIEAFEAEMHELQAELGEGWIVRFSVQGDDAWLTAETQDGSQHVEGPTAEILREAVEVLDAGSGRSG